MNEHFQYLKEGLVIETAARLESVYTPKAYPEFESRSLRNKKTACRLSFFVEERVHIAGKNAISWKSCIFV